MPAFLFACFGTQAKQFACSPATEKPACADFSFLLRGPESNGRPQVMGLMRYLFSTPL